MGIKISPTTAQARNRLLLLFVCGVIFPHFCHFWSLLLVNTFSQITHPKVSPQLDIKYGNLISFLYIYKNWLHLLCIVTMHNSHRTAKSVKTHFFQILKVRSNIEESFGHYHIT